MLYHPVATLSVHPNSIRLIARFETSCAVGQRTTPHDDIDSYDGGSSNLLMNLIDEIILLLSER